MKVHWIVFILMLMVFTGCNKADYDLNPWTTVLNQIVKQK
jgi:hypothetical protein